MKRRINVKDDVFSELLLIAAQLGIKGSKSNEKLESLFNNGVFLNEYRSMQKKLIEGDDVIKELQENSLSIDEGQLQRLNKLQTLNILSPNLSDAIKELINSYTETNRDNIQEAVSKI